MNLILFLLLAVGFHAVFLRLLRGDGELAPAERHAAAFTFQMLTWTVLSLFLGFAGGFRLVFLINGAAVVLALLWYATLFVKSVVPHVSMKESLREWARAIHPVAWFFAAVGVGTAGWYLWQGIWMPVISADGMSYHLGTAVHMVQDADFRHYPGESLYTNFFARGAEFFMAMSIMLTGKTVFVNAVQWLILPVATAAVYTSARAFGVRPAFALIAAMIPLMTPIVVLQSAVAYADLMSNGWLVVAMAALVGTARFGKPGPVRVLWFFSAAGLAVAAKFNASVMAVLLGLGAIALWGPKTMFSPRRGRLAITVAGFLLAFLAGGMWMVRNWVGFGSPLYPFSVAIGPLTVAHGFYPMDGARLMGEMGFQDIPFLTKLSRAWTAVDVTSWRKMGFPPDLSMLPREELYNFNYGYRADDMWSGFGALWIILLLPSMIATIVIAAVRKAWNATTLEKADRTYLYAMFLTAVPLLATRLQVAGWVPRFSLFLPFVGAVALAVVLEALSARMRLAAWVLVGAAAVIGTFDAATTVLYDRNRERVRRYFEAVPHANDTPVGYFHWLNPQNPDLRAIVQLMNRARPGDTVCFWTPDDPLYTGYFADEKASIRLFLFPSKFPNPFAYTNEEMRGFIEDEHIRLLLTSNGVPDDFRAMINRMGAKKVYENTQYQVYVFPARGVR